MNLKIISLLIVALVMPVAQALIYFPEIGDNTFYLGKTLPKGTITIQPDDDFNGLFALSLSCDDQSITFYTLPLNIDRDQRLRVEIPKMTAEITFEGSCFYLASLTTISGKLVEEAKSTRFKVSSSADLEVVPNKKEYLPGEKLTLTMTFGEGLDGEKEITVTGIEESAPFKTSSTKVTKTFSLPTSISSGEHKYSVSITDRHGNTAAFNDAYYITAVPTAIQVAIKPRDVLPSETATIIPFLSDQGNQEIPDNRIRVEVRSPNDDILLNQETTSSKALLYPFPTGSKPGFYKVLVTSDKLSFTDEIKVLEQEDLTTTITKNMVEFSNKGNVPITGMVGIELDGDEKHVIKRKISVGPQETANVDLSRLVPAGTYSVMVADIDGEKQEVMAQAKGVDLEDNRNILKKAGDGLGKITGKSVKLVGDTRMPFGMVLLLLIVVAAVILNGVHFFRKRKKPAEKKEPEYLTLPAKEEKNEGKI